MKTIEGSYISFASQLPLEKGDILFIASDIKQMALDCRSSGGKFDVNAFIESFQDVLSEGTLIIPSYTDYLKNGEIFDYVKSKPSTGALANKVQRRKDFIRTKDPLHSVFAWGKHADEIANINSDTTLGKGSIFDFLQLKNAKMICIDVDFQNSLTFVHYIEEKEKVNYRRAYDWKMKTIINGVEGQNEFTFHTKKPWILTDLYGLQAQSEKDGINQLYSSNKSKVQYFELNKMHDYILDYMKSGNKLYKVSFTHFTRTIVKRILGRS